MAEKKVNTDVIEPVNVSPRVEAGEVYKLSKDEQHLADLGYKQGMGPLILVTS
jgi:hypothetical protein